VANKITRRNFIQKSATIGASSIIGMPLLQGTVFASNTQRKAVDISVVQGENYFNNTVNAVEQLGGMKKFVSRGSQVGLLINCPHSNPGCHVKPEIVLAVVKMCYDAGAKEIACIKSPSQRYWSRSPMSEKFAEEIKSLKLSQGDFVKYEIKQGLKLKEANIARELLECDIFINIPINKNHEGTRFTGNLKNMMGACPYSTNSFFHNGSNAAGPYEDVEFLS